MSRTEKAVRAKCKEDLLSTTRYITWSLHTRNGFGLKALVGEARFPAAAQASMTRCLSGRLCMLRCTVTWERGCQSVQAFRAHDSAPVAAPSVRHSVRGHPVSDVLDGTLWNRELGSVSEEVVTALVHQLFQGIRDYLVQVCARLLRLLIS